jgi:predicted nucleotidyltransferase
MFDIELHRLNLENACREFSLRRLDLVGSAARADFQSDSDLDFLVTFEGDSGLFHRYFGLKERLEDIFQRPVDLIEERAVRNPYVRRTLQKDRVKVYEA